MDGLSGRLGLRGCLPFLFDKGWVRVSQYLGGRGGEIDVEARHLTSTTKNALLDFVEENADTRFMVELGGQFIFQGLGRELLDDMGVLRATSSALGNGIEATSTFEYSGGNFWISPDGALENAPDGHADAAIQIMREVYGEDLSDSGWDAIDALIADGWVRVHDDQFGVTYGVEAAFLTAGSKSALIEMAAKKPMAKFLIDVGGQIEFSGTGAKLLEDDTLETTASALHTADMATVPSEGGQYFMRGYPKWTYDVIARGTLSALYAQYSPRRLKFNYHIRECGTGARTAADHPGDLQMFGERKGYLLQYVPSHGEGAVDDFYLFVDEYIMRTEFPPVQYNKIADMATVQSEPQALRMVGAEHRYHIEGEGTLSVLYREWSARTQREFSVWIKEWMWSGATQVSLNILRQYGSRHGYLVRNTYDYTTRKANDTYYMFVDDDVRANRFEDTDAFVPPV
jgi:hypothetical protein